MTIDLGESSRVHLAESLEVLKGLPSGAFQMVYTDPPFNTGKTQKRLTLSTKRDPQGERVGFQGERYSSSIEASHSYEDAFDDYLAFLEPRIVEVHRLLTGSGTFYLHLDYREVHYAKVLADEIFGRECFLNEIIWAYDYGARTNKRWPPKHDNILVYVKDPSAYFFDNDSVDREPYMAPGLVGPDKAAKGKLPTDTWWHTIVPTNGQEKTGYPSQKPEGIVRRMVAASSSPGDWVLDFCAGSGTLGAVASQMGRKFVLIDQNPVAFQVMRKRLGESGVEYFEGRSSPPSIDVANTPPD